MPTRCSFIVAGVIACGCSQRPLYLPGPTAPAAVADLGAGDLTSPPAADLAPDAAPADLATAPRTDLAPAPLADMAHAATTDMARAATTDMARAATTDMARAATTDMANAPPICPAGLRLPSVPLVATSYPPTTVASADFDGDGILDLVSDAGSTLEIHFGNGDGTFKPAVKYGPLGINDLVTDDFNGDGKPDILVAYTTLNVVLNKGDGTFDPNALKWFKGVPLGAFMMQAVTGDFNHDGKRDVAGVSGAEIIVALGNGDGTFKPLIKYPETTPFGSVLAGDVDHDGNVDLVAFAEGGYAFSTPNGYFGVLRGNGDGTFGAVTYYGAPASGGSGDGALADLDHDGKLDVLVTGFRSNLVSLFRGNGDGTFAAATTFAGNSVPPSGFGSSYLAAIEVDDFNDDGKLDVATAEPPNGVDYDNFVNLSLGNGDGTFQAAVRVTTGSAPTALISGDFDRNGKLDLVTVDAHGGLGMLLGKGDGTFGEPDRYHVSDSPGAIASGDFDGDGNLDLVMAEGRNGGTAEIFLGSSSGHFTGAGSYATGDWPRNVATADLDRDGKLDLVITLESGVVPSTSDAVAVLLGHGDGSFSAPASHAVGANPSAMAIVDLDGNGLPDIVTADYGGSTVSVLLNRGQGVFAQSVQYATNNQTLGVGVGDYNRDGKLDIVASGYNPTALADTLILFLGKGDGSFAKGVYAGDVTGAIVSADFNGDGNLDILGGYDGYAGASNIVVLLGKGDGTFPRSVTSAGYFLGNMSGLAAADIDGDGRLDYVTLNNGLDEVSVLLGNGDGTFRLGSDYAGGWRPGALTLGDFDRDGRLDIATVATGEYVGYGELNVLFNRGCR